MKTYSQLVFSYDREGRLRERTIKASDVAASEFTVTTGSMRGPYKSPLRLDYPCLRIERVPTGPLRKDPWFDGDKRVPAILTTILIPHMQMLSGPLLVVVGLEVPNLLHAGDVRDLDDRSETGALFVQQIALF